MHARAHRVLAVAGAALVVALTPDVFAQDAGPTVLRAEVRGAITPVVANHLREVVGRAERERHDAVLVTLDTPGGLDTSMREIVRTFLNARVPVVVWVTPAGARAASAGAVIALAAHVAAMAPGTNIGAATPVAIQGGEVGDKIVNDAAAYVEAIAELRGRNREFARDIVRNGRSERATRAARIGAVDLVASDRTTLLRDLHGRRVRVGNETIRLRTQNASVISHDLSLVERARQRLADPNLAFLFISLGTLAFVYELVNPGIGFGGIAGAILVILGMFGLSVLPVNVVGVVLLLLAAALFIAELFVPGVGVLAGGGAVSLVLAGVFLVRGALGVDLAVILPTAVVVSVAVVLGGRLAWRTRRAAPVSGAEALRGRTATVGRADGRTGQVFLEGAWWTVHSPLPLTEGQRVRVKDVEGLELAVEGEEKA